jgi:hypothetical protein
MNSSVQLRRPIIPFLISILLMMPNMNDGASVRDDGGAGSVFTQLWRLRVQKKKTISGTRNSERRIQIGWAGRPAVWLRHRHPSLPVPGSRVQALTEPPGPPYPDDARRGCHHRRTYPCCPGSCPGLPARRRLKSCSKLG